MTGEPEASGLALAQSRMVDRLRRAGTPLRVLDAMRKVPREAYVPETHRRIAYAEQGLWLPSGAWLPPPPHAARLLSALDPQDGERILEIGTDTGYLTSLLAQLSDSVVTVDSADLTLGALTQVSGVRRATADMPFAGVSFDALVINRPAPDHPRSWLTIARRAVGIFELRRSQRLLLARGGAQGGAEVMDLGPVAYPTPWMAASVGTWLSLPYATIEGEGAWARSES